MLTAIEEMYREDALKLLRWIAYAQSPLTLGQLADAVIVDPAEDSVNIDDRGDLESTLQILSGLVITVRKNDGNNTSTNSAVEDNSVEDNNIEDVVGDFANDHRLISADMKVRLAHFSVKEYLESRRILEGHASIYHLEPAREHRFLAHSCLTYIINYSNSSVKTSTRQDLVAFPLLEYAARSWYYHSSLQQCGEASREALFLMSEEVKRNWLLVHQPDRYWESPFKYIPEVGSSLYYASSVGLEAVVHTLLERGAEVNAQGGTYGNALQAASYLGYENIATILLKRGADVNAQGGFYGNALQAASIRGDEKIVAILLERGAEVNAQGPLGNALQVASYKGYKNIVIMLLKQGADVNAQEGEYSTALQEALEEGHKKVAEILLEQGAEHPSSTCRVFGLRCKRHQSEAPRPQGDADVSS